MNLGEERLSAQFQWSVAGEERAELPHIQRASSPSITVLLATCFGAPQFVALIDPDQFGRCAFAPWAMVFKSPRRLMFEPRVGTFVWCQTDQQVCRDHHISSGSLTSAEDCCRNGG